jgi:uroporphyrinogen-III synthase
MRVLVTRPAADGERTARKLRRLGHEAVLAPVLAVRPLDAAVPSRDFTALVVTSANALHAIEGLPDPVRRGPAFAVGERSADALRRAGFTSVETAADAGALARSAALILPAGGVLLHLCGRDRKPEPEASLRAAGFMVVPVEVYEAAAVGQLPAAAESALGQARLAAALHYSRRSAEILLHLCDSAGLTAALLALPQHCLSADVAAPLRERGASALVVAPQPREDDLLAGLAPGGVSALRRA